MKHISSKRRNKLLKNNQAFEINSLLLLCPQLRERVFSYFTRTRRVCILGPQPLNYFNERATPSSDDLLFTIQCIQFVECMDDSVRRKSFSVSCGYCTIKLNVKRYIKWNPFAIRDGNETALKRTDDEDIDETLYRSLSITRKKSMRKRNVSRRHNDCWRCIGFLIWSSG